MGSYLVIGLLMGLIGAAIAGGKGRSRGVWFILCFLFWPAAFLPLIVLALLPNLRTRAAAAAVASAQAASQAQAATQATNQATTTVVVNMPAMPGQPAMPYAAAAPGQGMYLYPPHAGLPALAGATEQPQYAQIPVADTPRPHEDTTRR